MSLGQLVLELKLDGNEFTVDLKSASGALQQFVNGTKNANDALNRAGRSTRSWGEKLRDVVVTVALARDAIRTLGEATLGWQKAIADTNGQMQRSIQLMKSFSKETDPVEATAQAMADVNMLLTKASNAPFSLKAITDSFVKLRVSGIEPIEQGFNALIDSVAQFGGNDEALKRASVAIQQMAGKGVVSMEELRQQLGEAVPTAIQQMADGLGVTYSKLVKEISQGKVKSEPAIIAMFREMELQSKGSADRMMNTWQGAIAQLNTEFTKLLLTVGGFQESYGEGTYMHGITQGIKELTNILKDPSTQASAKAFGQGLTELMKAAIEGLKWVVEYRSAIYELGKAFLTIYAATKAVSIIRSLGASFVSLAASVTGAAGGIKSQMSAIATSFGQFTGGVAAMRNGSTAAAGAMSAMRGILGTIGGAAAIATGPIGMLTAAVAAGAYSWWEYKKAAQAGIQAMIDAKGQGAGLKEIMDAQNRIKQNNEDIANLQRDNRIASGKEPGLAGALGALSKDFIDTVGNNKLIQEKMKENAQLLDAIAVGEANVIKSKANIEFEAAKSAISEGMVKVEKEYDAAMKKQRDRLAEGEKTGADKKPEFNAESKAQKLAIETQRLRAEADLYNQQLDKIQKEIETKSETTSNGTVIGLDTKAIEARKLALNQLRVALGDVGQRQEQLIASSKSFDDTILGAAGAGGGKPQFDMLTMFVDKLRVSVAGLGAKAEEANPYLAQLDATVESLGGKKLPNFDQVYAEGKKLAETRWEQEKAAKAAKTASDGYKDALERVDQIDTTIRNKLNKVENMNPWEQASADAKRYEDELQDLADKLDETRQKAIASQREGTAQPIIDGLNKQADEYQRRMKEVQETIDRLKVSDVTKKMTEDSRTINESLMSSSDAITAQYQKSLADARAYYGEHKALMTEGSEAYAAYQAYLTSIEEKYRRDNESGLDAWIRANKDATDQYKSLWGSAMDQFNDTLVDGLIKGKLELSDFVTYVLKEFLRIQMAKQMAAAADAIGGGSGLLGSFGASLFGGGTGANGFAAGSAAATSSSLGASQAGYSSQYIKFANGGIMTDHGELALRKYANGGIADRPQLAMYGEGDMAEAFVPLPDGRSIPVTLSGGKNATGSQPTGAVPVEVNLYNQSGEKQEAESNARFDGEQMVVDIILKKVSQPGAVRDAVRTAAKS